MKYLKYVLAVASFGLFLPIASLAQQMFEGEPEARHSVVIEGYLPAFGDLVKIENDDDPSTDADLAVYYIDADFRRRAFPNQRIYESWYGDFSGVQEISAEDMAKIRLAGNIRYRPGTRLIKIPSIPKVYAVEPGGVLRWIETEAAAKALFGDDWSQRVDDVSETFFTEYTEGTPLVAPLWPTGTMVRRASDTALFVIDGMYKRHVRPGIASQIRAQERHIIETSSDLSGYDDGGDIFDGENKLVDTGEYYYVETLSPPVFDFPVTPTTVAAGEDVVLYVLRATSGMPIILRGMSVRMTGVWSGSESLVTDLRWVDAYTDNLFGIRQLESTGAAEETMTISGAYTMPENQSRVIMLKGRVSENAPEGHVITTRLHRDTFNVADGGNGKRFGNFWPAGEFPRFEMEVGR
ncbi:MAG: hypothetical protein U9Q03_01045 [Patescibacteria group bacterium]|nr:hypothetical protein [Patescibacteria group bacterium]